MHFKYHHNNNNRTAGEKKPNERTVAIIKCGTIGHRLYEAKHTRDVYILLRDFLFSFYFFYFFLALLFLHIIIHLCIRLDVFACVVGV